VGKKVLFIFGGTGDTAKQLLAADSRTRRDGIVESFKDDVIRVYFNGCQDSRISGLPIGGMLGPHLDFTAAGVRLCFNERGELSLDKLKGEFGSAIIIEPSSDEVVAVDEINLQGFSRGAVTTFATARYLDDLGKPISLFAEEPVPGNSKNYAANRSSEFYKNKDLRACKNLRHAEVVLGVYSKDVHPIHNAYFRQMAPLFNEACSSTISTIPSSSHGDYSAQSINHKIAFLYNRGLTSKANYVANYLTRVPFVPKVLQQKFHEGVIGRTETSSWYKAAAFERLRLFDSSGSWDASLRDVGIFKVGQAIIALDCMSDGPVKDRLIFRVKNDLSEEGKALREFIVELESINQYTLIDPKNERLYGIKQAFILSANTLVEAYRASGAGHLQKQELYNGLLNCVANVKGKISDKQFAIFQRVMNDFLRDNVIFHPDLTQYIDETETYTKKPSSADLGSRAGVDIKDVTSAAELAEKLYFMSERSRVSAYATVAGKLSSLVNNANELGNILRFLPATKFQDALRKIETKSIISSVDDINLIMEKLFTSEQRKKLFTAVKDRINDMNPTFEQLGGLMQYLDKSENESLIKAISFERLTSSPSVDMVKLFEKLSSEQVNHVLPLLEKKMAAYLSSHAAPDGGRALYTFLKTKVTEAAALTSLNNIFPGMKDIKDIVPDFKDRLADVTGRSASADAESIESSRPTSS
jgi:hypothetical protein